MSLIALRLGQILRRAEQILLIHRDASCNAHKRQSKILNKFVYGKETAKRKRFLDGDQPKLTTASTLTNPSRQGKNATRRMNVLNMLFMQYISDLLVNGAMSQHIAGFGLEISNVKIAPDFRCLNVYWIAKDEEIAEALKPIGGSIRHELSQLRLMGEVPKINFIKDSRLSKLAEVDALLAKADFGDDCNILPELDNANQLDSVDDFSHLPSMPHNMFGLNHDEIMAKIRQNMNKTRQAWQKYEAHKRTFGFDESTADTADTGETQNDKLFNKFLEEKQYNKGQVAKYKRERNNFDAREYYFNEVQQESNAIDASSWNDKDFVEEEFNEEK